VPERIVVIGDTPNDVRCARAIGAWAVAVPTGHTPVSELEAARPDLLTSSLEDHDAILAWLAA
jgi:phosphoglycolate phosphatase-like HAD superfamily hydrolase